LHIIIISAEANLYFISSTINVYVILYLKKGRVVVLVLQSATHTTCCCCYCCLL